MTAAERQELREIALAARARGDLAIAAQPLAGPRKATVWGPRDPRGRKSRRDRTLREMANRYSPIEADAMFGYVRMYVDLPSHKIGTMDAFCSKHSILKRDFVRALRVYRTNYPVHP